MPQKINTFKDKTARLTSAQNPSIRIWDKWREQFLAGGFWAWSSRRDVRWTPFWSAHGETIRSVSRDILSIRKRHSQNYLHNQHHWGYARYFATITLLSLKKTDLLHFHRLPPNKLNLFD